MNRRIEIEQRNTYSEIKIKRGKIERTYILDTLERKLRVSSWLFKKSLNSGVELHIFLIPRMRIVIRQ